MPDPQKKLIVQGTREGEEIVYFAFHVKMSSHNTIWRHMEEGGGSVAQYILKLRNTELQNVPAIRRYNLQELYSYNKTNEMH